MNDLFKTIKWRQHGLNFSLAGLACVALGAAMIIHNNAQDTLAATENSYQQQQAVNLEAENAANLLTEFLPSYKEFQQQGIIGKPQRLQWIETLQTNASLNLIPLVHFTLSPTTIASTTATTYSVGALQLKITPMQISFTLLHEGDFYNLLNALKAQSKGVFNAQNCNISRNEGEHVNDQMIKANSLDTDNPSSLDSYKGQCDLVWYSLADITSAWVEPTP